MKIKLAVSGLLLSGLILFLFPSCKISIDSTFRHVYDDYNTYVHSAPVDTGFLKVHYKNGNVAVYKKWVLSEDEISLYGDGKLFDARRTLVEDGKISTDLNQIAIIETNQLDQILDKTKSRIAGLSILAGVDAVIGVICITVPKACFGSCPTFYLQENNNVHYSNAEGFSSSISPSLENRDIDALNFQTNNRQFRIFMKNEALETHVINEVQLIAAAVEKGKFINHAFNDRFYQSANISNCRSAITEGTDVTSKFLGVDENEYFSLTDSTDLWKKEEIILEFNGKISNTPGLILNFRQTLLTTFLLYNGLSYMGNEVGDYFAKVETNSQIRKRLGNPFKKLGGIKVYYFDEEKEQWLFADEIYETGPIARNQQLIPFEKLKNTGKTIRVKLEITRGMWRMDYAGLADIEKEVFPELIAVSEITKNKLPDFDVLSKVNCDDEEYLISFPGDDWELYFDLPETETPNQSYELFLSSKGYYLEWIRESWLKDKNTKKLEKMLLNDKSTWRELAIEYKEYENIMEELFWNSKYETVQ